MIYDINAVALISAYSAQSEQIDTAYDVDGNIVFNPAPVPWEDEITVQTLRDTASNTTYYYIHIPQTRSNGQKQYPFVRVPYDKYPSAYGRMSAYNLTQDEGWLLTINAGLGMGPSLPIDGLAIQNNVLIHNSPAEYHIGSKPITIDENGTLGYVDADTSGESLVLAGFLSAVMGFYPIIINHANASETSVEHSTGWTTHAQRQIIGQFDNGDYAVLTCEGRSYASSTGWSMPEAQAICQNLNLKFAYNLDGGGSTETVICGEQINTIYETWTYEGETVYGRLVPSFIVFNGTDEFFIPNA